MINVPADVVPWPLVFEIAEATPRGSWVLVGGLMVHVHALRAGIATMRPTRDVDVLLNVSVAAATEVAAELIRLGFQTVAPSRGNPVHRFARNSEVVDVMVARDVRSSTRWRSRPILRSPGAAQALVRRDTYTFVSDRRHVDVDVPDSVGAMIAKAAAFAVDSRNPQRHLEDLAVLAAATGSARSIDLTELRKKDRRHLSRVVPLLADPGHVAWSVLDNYDQAIGRRVWAAVEAACPQGG